MKGKINRVQKPEESVWDYPRPPRVEAFPKMEVRHSGYVLAKSSSTFRVLEMSHPPVFYISPGDIMMEVLGKTGRTSICEFKRTAVYFNLITPELQIENSAWSYENPRRGYEAIKNHLAFSPQRLMPAMWVVRLIVWQ